jgi:hypothetical protein
MLTHAQFSAKQPMYKIQQSLLPGLCLSLYIVAISPLISMLSCDLELAIPEMREQSLERERGVISVQPQ